MLRFRPKNTKNGFTLLELLIAAAILTGTVLGFLMFFYASLLLMETNRNTIVAVNDAKAILEQIRETDPFSAANVAATYPASTDLIALVGPQKLNGETIYVAYPSGSSDPLRIVVTVNWSEKTLSRSVSLTTLMTQR